MADINTTSSRAHSRAGFGRMKKSSLKTDMTPMVDLGFLLISFFIFTAKLSEPHAMDLNMPADGTASHLGESNALTVLLGGNNKVFYYYGNGEKAIKENKIVETNYSLKEGMGKLIREKQKYLDMHPVNREGGSGLMLLIKPGKDASYRNVIDVLDEVLINNVKKYAIIKPANNETRYLQQQR